ncbi:hypothetical protein AB1046_08190 [Promicromonospora sp. Populi]|uniref:SecDF P1 head subdomain-containing protein n=1 Tax=Promicromonospora sp. Populi TaxID=3239420 RepID=UPI0034E1ECC4
MNRQARLMAAGLVLVFVVSGCGLFEDRRSIRVPRTQVELVAAPADAESVTPEAMADAAGVIQLRLEADGRDVSDVVVDDATITLELAGSGDPDQPLVTCGQEGDAKYVLGPVEVAGTELTEVSSGLQANYDGAAVNLQFDERGTEGFRAATERLQALTEPRNQIAVTLDDLVVSAPSIMEGVVITTGEVQITGAFTEESAATLAHQLSTDPLPYPFEVRDVAPTE